MMRPARWRALARARTRCLALATAVGAMAHDAGAQASVPAPRTAARLSAAAQPARAARALPRGTVITPDDIMVLGDTLPAELPLGWVTRRLVQPGEALRAPAVGPAPVVRTGHPVSLVAGSPLVRIVRTGSALEDGARGDTIRVRFHRGATITVVVRDSNTVVPVPSLHP